MSGHGEVDDSAAVMRQHEENVQELKTDRRDSEEINRNEAARVVLKKRTPGLRGRSRVADEVLADTRPSDFNAELQEFAVDARSAPGRVSRLMRRINSRTSLETGGRPVVPFWTFHVPEYPEQPSMPADDRFRLYNHQP